VFGKKTSLYGFMPGSLMLEPRAAQEVESQVTQLDEAEQAKGETAVQGEANAITDAIDALKEALGVQ